jgi:hypothetical protein
MYINETKSICDKSFLELLNDPAFIMANFEKQYFPISQNMEDGDVYILTNNYIYSNVGSVHYKYFHFDKDGNLLTDPKYNYTKLSYDGYLMRVFIRYPVSDEFQVDYFVKLDNLRFSKSSRKDKNTIKDLLVFDSIDFMDIVQGYMKSIVTNNPKEFFKEYLDYDLKK